jgi:hypothetical protein
MKEVPSFEVYEQSQKLQSWADLFGFHIEMGRDNFLPYVEVDGARFYSPNPLRALQEAAGMMGMEIEDLEVK